jgi:hypothetical protein
LEIIEVQSGGYLGEDDIVRFEDVYNRLDLRARYRRRRCRRGCRNVRVVRGPLRLFSEAPRCDGTVVSIGQ